MLWLHRSLSLARFITPFVAGLYRAGTSFLYVNRGAGTVMPMPGSDVERLSAEIGYWLGREFWGRGIMTEAVRAATAYALENLKLVRVFAVPFATNAASRYSSLPVAS